MHLVDDVHFIGANAGRIGGFIAQIADIIHAVIDAASISTTSSTEPLSSPVQTSHSQQGSAPFGLRQLTALAKILAQVVLPVPRVPVKI